MGGISINNKEIAQNIRENLTKYKSTKKMWLFNKYFECLIKDFFTSKFLFPFVKIIIKFGYFLI